MLKLTSAVAAAALISAISVLGATSAPAAEGVDMVCLVTYSNGVAAKNRDVVGVTAGSYMPRVTAQKLVTDYERIFDYPDQKTGAAACQCLHNPAPAHTLAMRDDALKACPKPTKIE